MAGQRVHKKSAVKLEIPVVGLSYRLTPARMEDLAGDTPLSIKLVREPTNAHDENAVAVHVTEKPWKNFHIGYLPRAVAAEVAPKLDAGTLEITEAWLLSVDLIESRGELAIKGVKRKSLENG